MARVKPSSGPIVHTNNTTRSYIELHYRNCKLVQDALIKSVEQLGMKQKQKTETQLTENQPSSRKAISAYHGPHLAAAQEN